MATALKSTALNERPMHAQERGFDEKLIIDG
jgi:hypothetical protein